MAVRTRVRWRGDPRRPGRGSRDATVPPTSMSERPWGDRLGSPPVSAAPPAPPVAFGLTEPLLLGLRRVARRPAPVLVPVVVLLLPLLPIALAARGVLRAGGDVALTGLIAGAPRRTEGAVILRPDGHGVRLLLVLALLLALAVAVVVTAGLVVGAATHGSDRVREALGRAGRAWPRIAATTVGVALVTALAAGVVVAVAVLAGGVRFQLTPVVLTLGLGALAVAVLRLSLWPALAVAREESHRAALRRAWASTDGHVLRLVLAAVVAAVGLALPTWLVGELVGFVLERLADAELVTLSPVAVGLWSLILVPVAVVVGAAVWGVGARAVALRVDADG